MSKVPKFPGEITFHASIRSHPERAADHLAGENFRAIRSWTSLESGHVSPYARRVRCDGGSAEEIINLGTSVKREQSPGTEGPAKGDVLYSHRREPA